MVSTLGLAGSDKILGATYYRLAAILYSYACGELSARQVQAQLGKLGYKANLRQAPHSHIVEVTRLADGGLFDIEV